MNPELFRLARDAWIKSSMKAARAREEYRIAYAQALLKSEGKTVDAKKAEADLATSELRLRRDETEIFAEADLHELLFVRGAPVGSAPPIAA